MPVQSYDGYRRNDDYLRDVARGGVPGAQPFSAYGEKTTTGSDSGVLWPNGAFAFPPAAGVQMSVVSSSTDDDSAGTGIRSIEIHGLDADLNVVSEVVTMDGTTPVLTVRTDWRFIQCVHMNTWGSGAEAAGNISISNGGQTYSYIAAGDVRCSSSVRMVPAGKRLLITSMFAGSVSGTAAASTVVRLASPTIFSHNYISANVLLPYASAGFQDSSSGITIPCPLVFTEGEAVGMTFETDKAATVTGVWFGWLENE